MLSILNINNLKTILIVVAIVAAVIFYKDYQHQRHENQRQSENISQLRKLDSFKFASQTYNQQEIDEYLQFMRKDLQDFLKENRIKTNRIEQIITQKLNYLDTIDRSTDLQPVLDAIKQQRNIRVPVIDSTDCLIVKGYVVFENDTLSLDITDRQFTNKTDVVSYWERQQWKFLGIKTRLFGRKVATVIIKDACGKTQTFVIDKRNKKLKP